MNRNTNSTSTKEKITVLIASVKEREQQLKLVINRIYNYVDVIELVLNWYTEIPEWILSKPKIVAHLNPQNAHAHDYIWNFVPSEGFVFVMDDDLLPPIDGKLFYKLIEDLRRYDLKRVVCTHGSNITLPASDYMDARCTYGFSDRLERDILVDVAGVGTVAFHSSTLQPSLQDFQIPFCRDLYFSLHCAKNNVKIVNVKRPSNWILPLQTPGETVYEATLNNKQLRTLKNRVMKEQLLPAIHCENHDGTGSYVLITDYGFDKRLMDKTLQTLDEVTDEQTNIVVFTDELKDYDFSSEQYTPKKKVLTQYVTPDERAIGRMGSKVLCCYRFVCGLPNGSRVIISDADMVFLRDPFGAFDKEFDLGVTSRCEPHHYPLNAGIIFMRVSNQLKDYLRFVIENLYTPSWPELASYQKRFGHSGTDWDWDQDALAVTYLMRDKIKERFGVNVFDVGPHYNFCPHADGSREQIASGKAKLLRAYHSESVVVLHLKSKLRELLFDGILI